MNARLGEADRVARAALLRDKGGDFGEVSARGVEAGSGDLIVFHAQRE